MSSIMGRKGLSYFLFNTEEKCFARLNTVSSEKVPSFMFTVVKKFLMVLIVFDKKDSVLSARTRAVDE